jgi:hypothetical protein
MGGRASRRLDKEGAAEQYLRCSRLTVAACLDVSMIWTCEEFISRSGEAGSWRAFRHELHASQEEAVAYSAPVALLLRELADSAGGRLVPGVP